MDDFGYDFDYTTEWQEVEFTLSGQDEIVWAGAFTGYSADVLTWTETKRRMPPRPEDEVVGRFEIDWIELTGPEERSQGELAPAVGEVFSL